jgi:hypothetical protein
MAGRCATMPKSRYIPAFPKKPLCLIFVLAGFATVAALAPVAALAAPEEPPAEPQPPQLVFEPGSYDFGLQQVHSGEQTTLQLRNIGAEGALVNLDAVGPGTGSIWIGNSNCYGTRLEPGQSCYVQMNFSPQEMTEYAVQVRAGVGSYTFTAGVTGTGGRAIFEPASNPTDFGVAAVGSAGNTREIRLSNAGNMPGGVFIAVIAGGAVGSFQLLDENCTGHPLAPAATCTLQVRFGPLSEGVKTATLGLFGEQEGGTEVVLTGVGISPAADSPSPAGSSPPPAAPAVLPKRKSPKHRPQIRRRHRRANLDVSRMVTPAG